MMSVRILIADDHAIFRSGLAALLRQEPDFEIVGETGDGFETLRAVSENEVDILLLDLSMPGISGSKVAESVLEEPSGPEIVILTMHEDEFYLRELLKIGVRGFVLKKSTGTNLVQAIRSAHRKETYVDPSLAGKVLTSVVLPKKQDRSGPLSLLTPREREVCRLLAFGYTNAEAAANLNLSERTIETHRANLMAKLELRSRAELVRFALEQELLKLD